MVVGDWLICTLMDWTLLRIFFWWPARVTPILSKSLGEMEKRANVLRYLETTVKMISITSVGRGPGSEPFHRAKHPSLRTKALTSHESPISDQGTIGGAQNTQIPQINLSHLREDLLHTLLCIAKRLR